MLLKRLNIMLYSEETGEQIIFPINPEKVHIKYEKDVEEFDILGYGKVGVMGHSKPVKIILSHFFPEDNSVFNTVDAIMSGINLLGSSMEYEFSSLRAVQILKNWTNEKNKIRLVIDDDVNIECIITSFRETLRESTTSKPYELEILEYKNPKVKTKGLFGLIRRISSISTPTNILMRKTDTIYSLASKYGLNFKKLAKINGIKDPNAALEGKKITTIGA